MRRAFLYRALTDLILRKFGRIIGVCGACCLLPAVPVCGRREFARIRRLSPAYFIAFCKKNRVAEFEYRVFRRPVLLIPYRPSVFFSFLLSSFVRHFPSRSTRWRVASLPLSVANEFDSCSRSVRGFEIYKNKKFPFPSCSRLICSKC